MTQGDRTGEAHGCRGGRFVTMSLQSALPRRPDLGLQHLGSRHGRLAGHVRGCGEGEAGVHVHRDHPRASASAPSPASSHGLPTLVIRRGPLARLSTNIPPAWRQALLPASVSGG